MELSQTERTPSANERYQMNPETEFHMFHYRKVEHSSRIKPWPLTLTLKLPHS